MSEDFDISQEETGFPLLKHSEKDPSEGNEDSSSKRHKKKKKKKKKRREERPHTRRDVTPRREEHDSRARNGAERGSQHHISESLHNVHRDHMEDQQQLNKHKANGLSCYSGNELDLCHTGMEKDMKYKYFDHSTTVNSTKTLSNGNGDVNGVYHRTLSDVEKITHPH